MTLANDIIQCRMPDFEHYLAQGETLDDIDEYGFTPLIECAITQQPHIASALLQRKADVNKADVTGRTPLHWAVDNHDVEMVKLLLAHGANPNAYTLAGLSILVFPILREQQHLKQLLYQHGAKLDFAMDFIHGKLLGHRFELKGDVDIVNAQGEFIELDYEGFILEFTVAMVKDALRRFTSSYSTKHLRAYFPRLHALIDGFERAEALLKLQHVKQLDAHHQRVFNHALQSPLLILPAASRGHAMGFIRYGQWWAKVDRGENSLKEGSVILYRMQHPERFDEAFLQAFLYQKQPREFFHQQVNDTLGLKAVGQLPLTSQIAGNCSWANIQAIVAAGYALQALDEEGHMNAAEAMDIYEQWVRWDQDRALNETIQRFYSVSPLRKASIAAMLGAVLFQACDHGEAHHIERAENILAVLMLPEYAYILKSYYEVYCIGRLSRRGNNLLKILDDCGIHPDIGVTPIATDLHRGKPRQHKE